ncbi:MAG: tetratricopeptide repeat protein, partial [Oceanidesulfovibrio sp.]
SMLVEIAESGGRIREAIGWNLDYLERLTPEDPRFAAARYRMAQLYRKAQDIDSWRSILEDLSTNRPDSLYGRMAAMDLRTHGIENNAREFAPNI